MLFFIPAEVIVNYLSSHCLLVYNEVRQQEIVDMYIEVTRNEPPEKTVNYTVDRTLPEAQNCKLVTLRH